MYASEILDSLRHGSRRCVCGPYLVQEYEPDRAFHPQFAGKLLYNLETRTPDNRRLATLAALDAPAYAKGDAHTRGTMLGVLLADASEAMENALDGAAA